MVIHLPGTITATLDFPLPNTAQQQPSPTQYSTVQHALKPLSNADHLRRKVYSSQASTIVTCSEIDDERDRPLEGQNGRVDMRQHADEPQSAPSPHMSDNPAAFDTTTSAVLGPSASTLSRDCLMDMAVVCE
ncbi:hypothetical protein ABEF95_013960 [Exophiala dermatitidis]